MQMQTRPPVPRPGGPESWGTPAQSAADAVDEADFAAMRMAYHAAGGFAGGDDLARLLEDTGRGSFASLEFEVDSRRPSWVFVCADGRPLWLYRMTGR